jgi:hypothetical protein
MTGHPKLLDAARCIALARLEEFQRQALRLAALVRQGGLDKSSAIDHLQDIAIAHNLPEVHGEDVITSILERAFADADFNPLRTEVA